MVSQTEVRQIVQSLPETFEEENYFSFFVLNKGKKKSIAWVWLERETPKKARVPNLNVLAVRVPSLDWKEAYLQSSPKKYFTEAHYNNYPAILVRLEEVEAEELFEMMLEAWRTQAPQTLVAAYNNQ
jgi:hypothetical protein